MEKISLEINEGIKSSFIYKEYLFWKSKVEADEVLIELKNQIDSLKDVICKTRDNQLIDEYYLKENEYKKNPAVEQYLICKENLNELLKSIVDILSLK